MPGGMNDEAEKNTASQMCGLSGNEAEKKELIRVVRTPSEETLIDLTGKKAGRGAYLCGKVECFKLAKKKQGT